MADFFITALRIVHDYHMLSVLYDKHRAITMATHDSIVKVAGDKEVVYIGDICTEIDGMRMFKVGSSKNLQKRSRKLNRELPNRFFLVFALPHASFRKIEEAFKEHDFFKANRRDVAATDGHNCTECFGIPPSVSLDFCVGILQDITAKCATTRIQAMRHDETIAAERTKQVEADASARKAEADVDLARCRLADQLLKLGRVDDALHILQPRIPRGPITRP